MFDCNIVTHGHITIVKMARPGWLSPSKMPLDVAIAHFNSARGKAILFDASTLKRANWAETGALIDLIIRLQREAALSIRPVLVGLCGLGPRAISRLNKYGLNNVIPVFEDVETALRSVPFKRIRLMNTRAVILSSTNETRMAPITSDNPVPMLDFLGKPVLDRVMERPNAFGISNYIVCADSKSDQFARHLCGSRGNSVFLVRNDMYDRFRNGALSNSIRSQIVSLEANHAVFDDQTVVLPGNLITHVDLAAMMDFHLKHDADITVEVQSRNTQHAAAQPGVNFEFGTGHTQDRKIGASPTAVNDDLCAYILHPRALVAFREKKRADCAVGLLSSAIQMGLKIGYFESAESRFPITCGREYYTAQRAALCDSDQRIAPEGEQIQHGVWRSPTSKVGRNVKFENECFIGAGAVLQQDTLFRGSCIASHNCLVEGKTVISNSILRPFTHVRTSTIVDSMIVGPDWAVNHLFADGSEQNNAPLAGVQRVGHIKRAPERVLQALDKIA
jgi:NDP-sugar pyrophosphorylase family protein